MASTPPVHLPAVALLNSVAFWQAKWRAEMLHARGNLSIPRFVALVRVERLELPRLAAPEPKSGVSTNFTIPAFRKPPRLISAADGERKARPRRVQGVPERGVSISPVFSGSKEK